MSRSLGNLLLAALVLAAASGVAGQSVGASAAGAGDPGQVREIRTAATDITKAFVDGDTRAFCDLSSPRVIKALKRTVSALLGLTGPCVDVAKPILSSGRSDFLTACEVKVARVTIRGHVAILDAPHGRGDRLVKVHGRWLVDLDNNPNHYNGVHGVAAYRKCLRPA